MKSAFLGVSGMALTMAAVAAHAQTPAPTPPTVADTPAPEAAAPASAAGLDDIVVTAQRRAENLQRAAVPVDVVSARELTAAGVVTAATLNAAVPSLNIQQVGGAVTTVFVRGVGNFTENGYSDPAVAFNLDGVYLGRPTSTTGTFFDLERIEVLKGPQGTLYGRNATGGAINVIPTRPKLGDNSLSVAGSYGNYKAFDFEGAANLAVGADAAVRIAGKVVDRHGYNDDGTSDEVGQAVRAQFLAKPSSTLTLRIAGDYAHQGGHGRGGDYSGTEVYTPGAAATANAPANYTYVPSGLPIYSGLLSPLERAYYANAVIPGAFIHPQPLTQPYNDNVNWGVTGQADLETSLGTLTVQPAYRRTDLDNLYNGPSFRGSIVDERDNQFSLEARFQGKRVGPVDWLVGAYYFDETVRARYAINQYQLIAFQNFTSKTRSYAGFARLTGHVSDRFRLVAGGRYTQDNKRFAGQAQNLIELCALAPPPFGPGCFGGPSLPTVLTLAQVPGAPTAPPPAGIVPYGANGNILLLLPNTVQRTLDKGRFTYRLAAEFDAGPRSLIYASFETGYHSGGFALAPGHETFAPEYLDAWTIGSKNRFFDNRLQINLEAFYWKYRDQQVSHFGLDAIGNNNFFTENLGRTTIKGIDAEGEFLATQTTRLTANVQYLDSRVKTFTYTVPRGPNDLPPVVGCAYAATTAGGAPVYAVNCAGKPGFNSPKWSVNLGVEQTVPLGDHKLVVSGAARYRSNLVSGFEYLPQQNTGGNTTYDANASFGAADDRWSVTAFVRNLTNRAVPYRTDYIQPVGNILTTQYGPPRTYGVRGAVKF